MNRRASSGRDAAAHVVERVLADGAFAAAALDAELGGSRLDARERALATELSYGVLRTLGYLDGQIASVARRGIKKTDTFLRAHVLVAAYQIYFLDRVPPSAAVNAAVTAVRSRRGPKVAGFVNALCRKLVERPRADRAEAVVESAPTWLRAALEQSVGDEARALLGVGLDMSLPVSVRVVVGAPLPAWLEQAAMGRVSPRARRLPRIGDLRQKEGHREGVFVVQEEGAQVVGLALGARPGERVLDACAGRGQKTTLLAEQLGGTGSLWATDLYPAKLRILTEELARLRLPPVETRGVDWTMGVADVPDGFDRVLVDAPCTGTGTLARRPEILLRLREEDPARLGAMAEKILRAATSRARPGGRVVFAVCSVLRAECEDVVARVSDALVPTAFDAPELSGFVPADATSFRLLPGVHGTDGYFVASFCRRNT